VPDWQQSVRDRLGPQFAGAHGEVVGELAGHLEEVYEELIRRGEFPAVAERQALAQVSDWLSLRKKLEGVREGDEMKNQQIRSVWMPGLLTTIIGFGLLRGILALGALPWWILQDHVSTLARLPVLRLEVWLFVIPWSIVLPLAGAAGSFASWRAGGRPGQRAIAALFPTLVIAGLAILFLLGKIFPSMIAGDPSYRHFLGALIPWVLVPSISLLLGSLPFLRLAAPAPQPA
jgi:hypothetical protein